VVTKRGSRPRAIASAPESTWWAPVPAIASSSSSVPSSFQANTTVFITSW
jgi:hypothetical protein